MAEERAPVDWLLRVGDGLNFIASSRFNIWGINTEVSNSKHFHEHAVKGDRLWFIKNKSMGQVLGMAIFDKFVKRVSEGEGKTMTNTELGWVTPGGYWDFECHYTDLVNLSGCNLLTNIKGPTTIRRFDDKCAINLPIVYDNIKIYSKMRFSFP